MSGRYSITSSSQELEKRYRAKFVNPEMYKTNVNASAGNFVPVITSESPGYIQLFQFGFTPNWAHKQIFKTHARAEGDLNKENNPSFNGNKGIATQPMFRKVLRSQRCTIPANAFIEGPVNYNLNKPYVFYPSREKETFSMAGVYDVWENKQTGERVKTFAIITTTSNMLAQRVGTDRIPVVLNRNDERIWLDTSVQTATAMSLLRPFESKRFNAYPISSRIKDKSLNDIELLQPTGKPVFKTYDYIIYQQLKLASSSVQQQPKRRLLDSASLQLMLF